MEQVDVAVAQLVELRGEAVRGVLRGDEGRGFALEESDEGGTARSFVGVVDADDLVVGDGDDPVVETAYGFLA